MTEQTEILLPPFQRGIHLITRLVMDHLPPLPEKGLLNIFIKHTSAALSIGENADPSVRYDLDNILDHLVPENEQWYTHTMEGPDDMPAHAKSLITGCSINIPISNKRMNLGTWQGIYLCEFRVNQPRRKILITLIS